MDIKTTNEIAGNIFGEIYDKCPFCNSRKVQDKPNETRWYCYKCKKYFIEPITLMDEGIPLDKKWVSVESMKKEINKIWGEIQKLENDKMLDAVSKSWVAFVGIKLSQLKKRLL